MIKKKKNSRRSAIRNMGSIGAAAALGTTLSTLNASAVSKKSTAFALIGDRWHNPDFIRTALTKTLVEEAGLTIDFTNEVEHLSTETLEDYKMLIIYRDGMIFPGGYDIPFSIYNPEKTEIICDPPWPGFGGNPGMWKSPRKAGEPPFPRFDSTPQAWMTEDQGKAVKEFVKNGGGLYIYHNSTHISCTNKDYRDVIGAVYTGHPPLRPYKVHIVNREHPITRGVNDFIITDGQHYVIYDKDPGYVFMRSINEDGLEYTGSHGNQGVSCESGWAYDYGKGRVCVTLPGHMFVAMWNPGYIKIQQNAVKWLLREI